MRQAEQTNKQAAERASKWPKRRPNGLAAPGQLFRHHCNASARPGGHCLKRARNRLHIRPAGGQTSAPARCLRRPDV